MARFGAYIAKKQEEGINLSHHIPDSAGITEHINQRPVYPNAGRYFFSCTTIQWNQRPYRGGNENGQAARRKGRCISANVAACAAICDRKIRRYG